MKPISYILPFYRRLYPFRMALAHNLPYMEQGAEVVLVLDDPADEGGVLSTVEEYKDRIKFRVIVNDEPHTWRPPSRAINVGVRNSSYETIAVLSPESVLMLPEPGYLHGISPNGFLTGMVTSRWAHEGLPLFSDFKNVQVNYGFGFIMARKAMIDIVQGWDEARTKHGGDDDDIRWRLQAAGFLGIQDFNVRVVHLAHEPACTRTPRADMDPFGGIITQPDWGKSFSRVAWDWRK